MNKASLMTALLFTIVMGTMAQNNTSYNGNTIPIGGAYSTAFGIDALTLNTGDFNTANGYQTLLYNTTGSSNTAIGQGALRSNKYGSSNTATGSGALVYNEIGYFNTANGTASLAYNISGNRNTANGYQALYRNNNGFNNVANGSSALGENTSGNENVATGVSSLSFNTSGYGNTANGAVSLFWNQIGNNNIAVGDSAGINSLGSGNIYLGKSAGFYEIGSNKLYMGNDSNKTIIYGDLASGQLLLGNQQPTGYIFKGTRTLNVLGGVLADSVRVSLSSNWADYVFANNYPLTPIAELERFIKTNKHLPNIPTAEEVAANGIELGAMNAKMLEKIEELTLYIIQQQKQMDTQQKQIDVLMKMVSQAN